ncbi:hypothetical protein DDZ16_14025 [Marinilabilia rubra]|uniref:Uncharacterized protein n=1 Tax=Marinilabilia rubra TaxID=2162893 RepID=A0A2U2B701_9BACT|nr:hypothetical protein DDZ16_14025 [Marinilabilia rubra]
MRFTGRFLSTLFNLILFIQKANPAIQKLTSVIQKVSGIFLNFFADCCFSESEFCVCEDEKLK